MIHAMSKFGPAKTLENVAPVPKTAVSAFLSAMAAFISASVLKED